MRAALERWIKETGDLGGLDEDKLIERMWPGRKQPITAMPTMEAIRVASGKVKVRISCATEGTSIGYRLGDEGRWLIYAGPVLLETGDVLQAKAIRIDYSESNIVQLVL
jgi:hypothetical protein